MTKGAVRHPLLHGLGVQFCGLHHVAHHHYHRAGHRRHTWARMASLIETCKINHIDPYAYLRGILEAIANGHPKSQIDDLMPWAYAKTSSR